MFQYAEYADIIVSFSLALNNPPQDARIPSQGRMCMTVFSSVLSTALTVPQLALLQAVSVGMLCIP